MHHEGRKASSRDVASTYVITILSPSLHPSSSSRWSASTRSELPSRFHPHGLPSRFNPPRAAFPLQLALYVTRGTLTSHHPCQREGSAPRELSQSPNPPHPASPFCSRHHPHFESIATPSSTGSTGTQSEEHHKDDKETLPSPPPFVLLSSLLARFSPISIPSTVARPPWNPRGARLVRAKATG